jgi:hypothetical protein
MPRLLIITVLIALTACIPSNESKVKTSTYEIKGTTAERVARVSAIIAKHKAVPTAILDANFFEEQLGDGVLGPSDFRSFYYIKVAPKDVKQWTQMLTPLTTNASYTALGKSCKNCNWWVSRNTSNALKFYQSITLTGHPQGWIGVSPQSGSIYIFSFTKIEAKPLT